MFIYWHVAYSQFEILSFYDLTSLQKHLMVASSNSLSTWLSSIAPISSQAQWGECSSILKDVLKFSSGKYWQSYCRLIAYYDRVCCMHIFVKEISPAIVKYILNSNTLLVCITILPQYPETSCHLSTSSLDRQKKKERVEKICIKLNNKKVNLKVFPKLIHFSRPETIAAEIKKCQWERTS